ncbi:hypothetical protein [Herbaspirillum lusitanum]|uniref:hypothetical protein n=1 Tax=Herbaspirillum lusitanum TaxID=213312 RepID=UPI000319E69E|nr:hypothetical protein [Herbaspirillum lusitanum]
MATFAAERAFPAIWHSLPGQPAGRQYVRFGKTAKAPMLWIYIENDQYFNPAHSKAWHAAFVKAGGFHEDIATIPCARGAAAGKLRSASAARANSACRRRRDSLGTSSGTTPVATGG